MSGLVISRTKVTGVRVISDSDIELSYEDGRTAKVENPQLAQNLGEALVEFVWGAIR